jgi:hypothetical protein
MIGLLVFLKLKQFLRLIAILSGCSAIKTGIEIRLVKH